jgi:hypothetical protein
MKKFRNIIFFIAVIIFAAVAIFGYFQFNKPHRDVQKAKVDVTITASDLLKEFEMNSAQASGKYTGKILLVSGKLESINLSDTIASVQLSAGGSFFGVNCSFNKNAIPKLKEVQKGAEIKVKGECKGYIDDVILNNCFLIK